MAKDPAFLFYPGDWLGGTMGMTLEEKGAYMELLILQFNRGHMTSHMVAQTVGQIFENIEDKFEIDPNGKYFNRRLDEEKDKRKRYSESRKNNLEGKNQYSKDQNNKGHIKGHMTSHMENENIYVVNNINNKGITKNILDLNVQCFNLTDEQKKERGQAFYKIMVNDKGWQDLIKTSNQLTAEYKLELKIVSFIQEVVAGDDIFMNLSQLRKYFTKWIKKNK